MKKQEQPDYRFSKLPVPTPEECKAVKEKIYNIFDTQQDCADALGVTIYNLNMALRGKNRALFNRIKQLFIRTKKRQAR